MASVKQHIDFDSNTGSTLARPSEGVNLPLEQQLCDYAKVSPPPYTGTVPSYLAPDRVSAKGIASFKPVTVMTAFSRAVARCGDKLAVQSCDVKRSWTWRQYEADIKQCARALIKFGFEQHDAINICGFNSPEWVILDLGAIFAGGMGAGVYASNSSEQCIYQAEHSKAKVVAVESLAQLEKYAVDPELQPKNIRLYICWDESAKIDDALRARFPAAQVLLYSEFMQRGREANAVEEGEELKRRIAQTKPGHICALIYTSGTTGKPKAVSVTHDSCIWVSATTWAQLAGDDDMSDLPFGVKVVSFLPLSHVAALLLDVFAPLYCAAFLENTAALFFADANALKGSLLDALLRVRPTHFFAVPRVYEKFQAKMMEKGKAAGFIQRKLSAWARAKGMELLRIRENRQVRANSKFPRFWFIAKRLLHKARVNTGLDQCRILLVGAAPINRSTMEFFASLNMCIVETYGMSECTGPATIAHMYGGYKLGSCGVPLAGTEIKIAHVAGRDKAGEGEVCMRGRHIMAGYLHDAEKSNEAVDEEGWLHSGDVGRVDEAGFLYITGRIKEILIGRGGENVAPVPVEEYVKERCNKGIANFVMCGNDEKYFVALCTPKCLPDAQTGGFTEELDPDALQIDPACRTASDASKSKLWHAFVQGAISEYNAKGAVSHAAKIQKFTILSKDFSIITEELGPTLKLKRNVVYEKYKTEIAALYTAEE